MATIITSLEEIPKRRLIESARAYALCSSTLSHSFDDDQV